MAVEVSWKAWEFNGSNIKKLQLGEHSNNHENSSGIPVNREPTSTMPRPSSDYESRYDLVVEMLSGGSSITEAAKAIGFTKPRMMRACQSIIEIGISKGIPSTAMENILFPRRPGKKGECSEAQRYSAPAVTIETAARLARWDVSAEAVRQAQDEMERLGLRDLEVLMKLGRPPRPLYEPSYSSICADSYIFVYKCGFRVANEWSSWNGTHGFLTEIRGLIDLHEAYWLLDHHMDSHAEGKAPPEICFVLRLSRDLQDPKSALIYCRRADLGFAVPPGGEVEVMKFFEGIRTKFRNRKKFAEIALKVSLSSDNDGRLPGCVSYELIR